MQNIYDIWFRCIKKWVHLTHSCKFGMRNVKFETIDQHMNVTHQMLSLEKN
jgi:hypothetical protein